MPSDSTIGAASSAPDTEIPDGYAAVAVSYAELTGRLRVCVLLRLKPTPVQLIELRETTDGKAFLGCVVDAAGLVHRWLEVWVQNIGGVMSAPAVVIETLSNALLDDRWERAVGALAVIDPKAVIRTGWEVKPSPAVWIDPASRQPVQPMDPQSGEPWILCREEAALAGASLPPYGSTLHRYLYLRKLAAQSPLIPITPDSPVSAKTKSLESLLKDRGELLPLNVGGLMFIRAFDPMSYESLLDILSGRPGTPELQERLPPNLRMQPEAVQGLVGKEGWLFLGQHGRWGRLLEGFHLKLRALAGAVAVARAAVEHTRRPLLNLSADSFRVHMGQGAPGLPALWTARVVLAHGGDAMEVPVRASDTRYYIPRPRSLSAIYRPSRTGEPSRGTGTARIRKTFPEMADGMVVEGTLVTQDRLEASASDLIWLRINYDDGRVDLYARLEADPALAMGEWRFRSVGQKVDAALSARLRGNEGRPAAATFEILPVLSSPCDLYSLAVLAVRTFLVNNSASLPVTLDETLSLARQVANRHDSASPLRLRMRAVFESDRRWLATLGPHRLAWENVSPQEALDLIPLELWMDTLAMIIAMFPGLGPDSACADFGAAPQLALQRVFDRAAGDLESLLVRTRSLIVIDWRYNREIHSVIRGYLAGISPVK